MLQKQRLKEFQLFPRCTILETKMYKLEKMMLHALIALLLLGMVRNEQT